MIAHHLQKQIIDTLVGSESSRYADIKPEDIEGNIFTYHLQQLIGNKYVVKNNDGSYSLTALGKAIGVNNKLKRGEVLQQAHSILLLAVRNEQGQWLLRRRRVQPMFDKVGFLHGEPTYSEAITETARTRLLEKTGLNAKFTPRGSGYIRILKGTELESFTHFTLLATDNATGELQTEDKTGINFWVDTVEYSDDSMIPSMHELVEHLQNPEFFFAELRYEL